MNDTTMRLHTHYARRRPTHSPTCAPHGHAACERPQTLARKATRTWALVGDCNNALVSDALAVAQVLCVHVSTSERASDAHQQPHAPHHTTVQAHRK
jgi:hypothetical protein